MRRRRRSAGAGSTDGASCNCSIQRRLGSSRSTRTAWQVGPTQRFGGAPRRPDRMARSVGSAGLSYAAALLLSHTDRRHDHPSIRAVAGAAGMSHGAVGDASKLLREAGLVRPSGEPQTPELFWALADVWGPARLVPVASLPRPSDETRLQMEVGELDEPGWANGGDAAAAAWGAPVFDAGAQPRIWVPTGTVARRAERTLERASWDDCVAVLAVAPTLIACRNRMRPDRPPAPHFLPTLHPLFLALELAQDPARGREVVEQWNLDQCRGRTCLVIPTRSFSPTITSTLVEAARAVLATSDLPPVVLIGGLAVAIRVGSTGQPHRATVDIDLVTTETDPAAVEILADAHDSARHPLVIEGVKVDLIATMKASATDLADLDDDDRLFVAGHRWAFETGVLHRRPSRRRRTVVGAGRHAGRPRRHQVPCDRRAVDAPTVDQDAGRPPRSLPSRRAVRPPRCGQPGDQNRAGRGRRGDRYGRRARDPCQPCGGDQQDAVGFAVARRSRRGRRCHGGLRRGSAAGLTPRLRSPRLSPQISDTCQYGGSRDNSATTENPDLPGLSRTSRHRAGQPSRDS